MVVVKSLLYACMLILLIVFPSEAADAAAKALSIWGLSVVPSLFPYMVFSRLLAKRLKLKRFPPLPAAAILGILGGSPAGASVLSAYGDCLPYRMRCSMAALCGTLSPMFFIGTVGGWIGNRRIGWILLICHLLGAGITALIVYASVRDQHNQIRTGISDSKETDPMSESIHAVLNVGGYIVIYSVMAHLLLPLFPGESQYLLHVMLEAAGGVHKICHAPVSPTGKMLAITFGCGFGGMSVISQNLLFLRPIGLTMSRLLLFGLIRAAITLAVLWCFIL